MSRWVPPPAVGMLAIGLLGVLSVAGCSCNAPNTFDQRYCQAYASNTPVPALAVGVTFFALTLLVIMFVRRRNPADSGPAVDPGANSLAAETDGSASARLDSLIASGAVAGRILEGFDGRWVVELTFGTGREAEVLVTRWADREAACREALDEIERRQQGSENESG